VLDDWPADYQLGERHELLVATNRATVRAAVDELDLLRAIARRAERATPRLP
jgi:hypothetical protein